MLAHYKVASWCEFPLFELATWNNDRGMRERLVDKLAYHRGWILGCHLLRLRRPVLHPVCSR